MELQLYPPSQRNKEMYAPGFGTDQPVNGVPGASYQGHFEVYYPDTTVVIFGDAAPKGHVASFLVEGPRRLADLAEYGLHFDDECLHNIRGCDADRSALGEDAEFLLSVGFFYGLFYFIPFLAALFLGRRWLLLVPVVLWSLFFVAGSLGWVATGENWQFFVIPMMLLGVAVVGFGLALRWLFLEAMRRRREARA
jgi:hypothetical protein